MLLHAITASSTLPRAVSVSFAFLILSLILLKNTVEDEAIRIQPALHSDALWRWLSGEIDVGHFETIHCATALFSLHGLAARASWRASASSTTRSTAAQHFCVVAPEGRRAISPGCGAAKGACRRAPRSADD